ncbi:large conductance mechanosensitive channel protein MscL [Sphingomonas abietis]|uniref:Large-conductance mechanosensitive channel n=1 Tax=Sphingomonas abietis TaxID=3012344 RepID=A0ABY7NNC3_9SPHN|nr:large conductance mechanosensitive channel protein MscL [Sphingomonas abietis]WBO23022.1 large conductance mechanosensitive channel protein MscL [Sphingomonas abietis]
MLKEFKTFVMRGNVLDLAVAVIIGGAFGKIVTSLTEDIIMPLIGKVLGGLDFSSYFLLLGPIPASYTGSPTDYAALKKAGVALWGYGAFVTQVVNFLIVAFIIFLVVRAVGKAMALTAKKEAEAPATPAPDSAEVVLLREIRDSLKTRS